MKKGERDEAGWEKRYRELAAFKKKYGHTLVPQKRMKSLNAWCYSMRLKKNMLPADQRKKLEKLGFEWSDAFTQKWEIRFEELVEFKRKYGHTFVPKSMKTLYAWSRSLRKTKNQLSRERKARLKKLGFSWKGARPKN